MPSVPVLEVFFALVDAAGGTGFPDYYPAESWQDRVEPLPYPACQVFAGWIGKPIDFVQIVMIKLVVERLEGLFDVAEVHDPAGLWINKPAHV